MATQPLCVGFSGFEFKMPPPTGEYAGCRSQVDYGGSSNRFYHQREGYERLLALRICDAYFFAQWYKLYLPLLNWVLTKPAILPIFIVPFPTLSLKKK